MDLARRDENQHRRLDVVRLEINGASALSLADPKHLIQIVTMRSVNIPFGIVEGFLEALDAKTPPLG
jgi:hypothetical protein